MKEDEDEGEQQEGEEFPILYAAIPIGKVICVGYTIFFEVLF